jgi:methylthioribose-1-phosphate isomerase
MKDFHSLALKIENNVLFLLDQTQLPHSEVWVGCELEKNIIEAILQLKVRGAPLIGLAASAFWELQKENGLNEAELHALAARLLETRPTAVNLRNNLEAMLGGTDWFDLAKEDIELCERMAEAGGSLIKRGDQLLTHCNTGGLATLGVGTALGVIKKAHADGKDIHVWVDETRPLLQGGRLTAWELDQAKVSHQIICDSMAAQLMKTGKVDHVFVGADRICSNGDFANKIGTYSLAVLCKHHSIPFTVVAPTTTVDHSTLKGDDIVIEERPAAEVKGFAHPHKGVSWSPEASKVFNPAFDVTPAELVSHWVVDGSVINDASHL